MYTNVLNILNQLKTQIELSTLLLLPTATVSLDEPIDLVYDSLPEICIYPLTENLSYDESYSQYKKALTVRIEIRLKGSPASIIATPVVNAICDNLTSDLRLNQLVDYLEIQTIQWANDRASEGNVCGASLDLNISYLI